MYESCATCAKVGVSCRGPRFDRMTAEEVIALCKARKAFLHLSNQVIAERANMSKGTVDGLFAAAHTDFRFETIRPVWNVLFGGDMPDDACNDLTDSERVAYEEKIRQLENRIVWHEDKIHDLKEKNASLETLVVNTNARMTKDKDFLRDQIKSKNRAIIILSISLALLMLLIIAALIIDRNDPGVGFFWLESWFKPHSVKDGMNLIGKS